MQVAEGGSIRRQLVCASALMLLLELALIRWTGANVAHLSYFSNFVLVGSFLGIGLGFLRASRSSSWPWYSLIALATLIVAVTLRPVQVVPTDRDVQFFTTLQAQGPPIWVTLPVIFIATALVMMGPAQMVARCFMVLPRLEAYRFDLLGSLLGVALFTLLAFLRAPPVVWGAMVVVAFLALSRVRPPLRALVAGAAILATLGAQSREADKRWSPYYEITVNDFGTPGAPLVSLDVNGIPHQAILPLETRLRSESSYALPYERTATKRLDDVLVIGAGNGVDTALALRKGARKVDAVEIDPVLRDLGRELNPDRPYSDPRVTSIIDDGRAFLQRTNRRYDLILFALPDSLTLVSGASSLRLESYLFTTEALRAAKARLKPGGAFAMYNYWRERVLVDRFAWTAATAFGHNPCVDDAGGAEAVITIGRTAADQRCATTWPGPPEGTPAPATDDRPFPYLKRRAIPTLYLVTLVLIVTLSLVAVDRLGAPMREMRDYGDLFLLGTGFLLLETKAVTGFALLFGTTWIVNAIVFAGVLVAVLCAVEVTRRWRTPSIPVLYALVAAGLALAWLVPSSTLLDMSIPVRLVAAVFIAFLPIFAVNVVFAKRFEAAANPTVAFGANLLGGVLGGCLEYVALVVGHRALLLVAGAVYVCAYAVLRLRGTVAGARFARAAALGGPPLLLVGMWVLMASGTSGSQGIDISLYNHHAYRIYDGDFPYRDFFVEYPPGSLLPMMLAGLVGLSEDVFARAFEILMLISLLVIQASARRLAGRHGQAVAWAIVLVPVLVGPLARERLDLFPLALMVGGLALLYTGTIRDVTSQRHVLAAFVLLALGTATKVFPVIAAAAALAWLVGRGDRRLAFRAAGAFAVTVVAATAPFLAIAGQGFVDGATFQLERPIQVESTPAMALRLIGGPVITGTEQTPSERRAQSLERGPAMAVAAVFGTLIAAALLVMTTQAVAAGRRRAPPDVVAVAALAGLVAFVGLGQVLSPQFVLWVAPLAPLAWWLGSRLAAAAIVVAAVLTQWMFPAHYAEVANGLTPGITVAAVRDVLLVLAAVALLAVRARPGTRATS